MREKRKELEIKYKGDRDRLKRAVDRMSYKISYEYLILNFAGYAGKKVGEFLIPPEVSTLIAK